MGSHKPGCTLKIQQRTPSPGEAEHWEAERMRPTALLATPPKLAGTAGSPQKAAHQALLTCKECGRKGAR